MTKQMKITAKIETVPTPELRSQPISATHRQEFVLEFTRIIFEPRIVKAVPKDMSNFMEDLDAQRSMLYDAFPILQKKDLREVYGERNPMHRSLRFSHDQYNDVLGRFQYNHSIEDHMFGGQVRGDNITGAVSAFAKSLHAGITNALPNVKASKDYAISLRKQWDENNVENQPDTCYIYLPNHVSNLFDLVTDKKSQSKSGQVSRTPIIKSQFVGVIPTKVQARILAWVKKGRAEVGVQKLEQEVQTMFEFSRQLYDGLKCVRNTKQFQERHPDMFNEFCSITGLGQCDGKDLVSFTDMSTVMSILMEYKKG